MNVKTRECGTVRRVLKTSGLSIFAYFHACTFAYSAPAEQVKVMTYNIRYSDGDRNSPDNNWAARREALAQLVENEKPDVAGFQEVLPDQRAWLEKRFPQYAFSGCGRNADRASGEASPIAYLKERFVTVTNGTFWLSTVPDEPGSVSWGAKYPRICTWAVLEDKTGGGCFSFANTHTDHKSEEAREKGMLLIIERMREFGANAPIVLVGDHNCLEFDRPSLAVKKLLDDALYLSSTPPEGSWRTCNHWVWLEKDMTIAEALKKPIRERSAKGDVSERIDYIYVSPGTKVSDYRTLPATCPGTKRFPSDHFPSVATLVFPKYSSQ